MVIPLLIIGKYKRSNSFKSDNNSFKTKIVSITDIKKISIIEFTMYK